MLVIFVGARTHTHTHTPVLSLEPLRGSVQTLSHPHGKRLMQEPVPQCGCQSAPNFVSCTAAPRSDVRSRACCVFVVLSGAASQPFSGDLRFCSAARLLSRRSLMIGFSLS